MKFLNLLTLTALSWWSLPALGKSLPDRQLLRALTRGQHQHLGLIESPHEPLHIRQTTTGRCGANYGRCPDNLCCSEYGYCGDTVDHCYPGFDCQPAYGVCGWPRPVATTTTLTTISPTSSTFTTTSTSAGPTFTLPPGQVSSRDGRCGNGQNCLGSAYGRCCSQFGWCGDGDQFCPYIVGCQPEFGYCDPQPATF